MNKFPLLILIVFLNIQTREILQTKDPGYPNKGNLPKKEEAKYFELDSNFLKYLDGVTNAMDGGAIAEVIQVRKLIKDLQEGILDSKVVNGKTKTEYIYFQKEKKSLKELCNIEHKLLKQYESTKDLAVKGAIIGQLEELKECLKQVKHSFIQSTKKFMERIEPAKQFVIKLIEDSCRKRKIPFKDTIMLDWANTKGNEEAVFNDRIKNFGDFSKFLHQVYNFLGDLTKSCKKGFKQYLQDKKGK